MTYLKFKQYLREYCKCRKISLPLINARHKLHRSYENSLWTAPVLDNEETLEQFLRNTNWTDVFNKPIEEKYCIDLDCRGCGLPRDEVGFEAAKKKKSKWVDCCEVPTKCNIFELAPLPKAVPLSVGIQGCKADWIIIDDVIKEEGKTPMRYNDNYASANAYVASTQSDTAKERDFLLDELAKADYPKQKELQKVFNRYVDNTPKTYKEMIDIIKAGTYTIDSKIAKKLEDRAAEDDFEYGGYGPMYGIVWPGPVADWDGYHAAEVEKTKQYAVAKRVIMTGDAAAGLKALQDFEAWLPVGKAN